jgi:hypothetical protein
MQQVHEELQDILANYPAEEVIARIEALNPDWKYDLLPWKLAQPGEEIPWQAVYILESLEQANTEATNWAEQRLAELKASGDVP